MSVDNRQHAAYDDAPQMSETSVTVVSMPVCGYITCSREIPAHITLHCKGTQLLHGGRTVS
jgi:hypothetical protein